MKQTEKAEKEFKISIFTFFKEIEVGRVSTVLELECLKQSYLGNLEIKANYQN